MSYIELSKQNSINREKAKRLDAIENDLRTKKTAEAMTNQRLAQYEQEQRRILQEQDRMFKQREIEQAQMFQAREAEQAEMSRIREEKAYQKGLDDPGKTVLPKLLGEDPDKSLDVKEALRPEGVTEHDEEIQKFIDSL